jgi:hypothetical protein
MESPDPAEHDSPYVVADHLRRMFSWNVTVESDSVRLQLSGAVAAVIVPPCHVLRICRQVEEWGDPCAALRIPGARGEVAAILADARDFVAGLERLPRGVTVWSANGLLLPPTNTDSGRVRWLRRPDPRQRWLPTARSIVCASGLLPARRGSGSP